MSNKPKKEKKKKSRLKLESLYYRLQDTECRLTGENGEKSEQPLGNDGRRVKEGILGKHINRKWERTGRGEELGPGQC